MSQPFIGEVRMFSGNFAPIGWLICNGQILAISGNEALFALLGTTYGGDGQSTFAIPNLQSRIPVHQGAGFVIGQMGGKEAVALALNELPAHSHVPQGQTADATLTDPTGNVWATGAQVKQFSSATPTVPMSPVGVAGESLPHDNMLPFLTINFIISLFGIFPTQN